MPTVVITVRDVVDEDGKETVGITAECFPPIEKDEAGEWEMSHAQIMAFGMIQHASGAGDVESASVPAEDEDDD